MGRSHIHARDFRRYLLRIEPSKHIITGRRGSEENVKLKFTVPLLEHLGFDRITDLDFEMNGVDIGVRANGTLALIVECKAWGELLTDHLPQCLEYTLTSGIPFVLITSGQASALHSPLVNCTSLRETQPIIAFRFEDLTGKDSGRALERLHALIGKESLVSGGQALRTAVEEQLGHGKNLRRRRSRSTTARDSSRGMIRA